MKQKRKQKHKQKHKKGGKKVVVPSKSATGKKDAQAKATLAKPAETLRGEMDDRTRAPRRQWFLFAAPPRFDHASRWAQGILARLSQST